jgi:hypothetical protein
MPTAKGFSLIEILIAITFVSVLTLVMVSSLTFSSQLRWYNQEKIQASLYAQGGLEAVQALPWSAVANGDYGLDITNDVLKLATPPETLDGRFNRVITISDVHRANQTNGQVYGAIVDTGGYLDPNTKKITATISWRGHSGIDRQLTLIDYRHLWQASRWVQTDWSGGSGQSAWSTTTPNVFTSKDAGADTTTAGIVTLTAGFIDWTQATTTGTYNTAGNFDDEDVYEKDGKAYLVTDNNSSGAELYILDVTNNQSPRLLGSLDIGSGVNSVVVYGTYAYLATDDNSKEVQIVNVTNPASPSVVASYNITGNSDALDIAVNENNVYVLQGSALYAYSKTSPTVLVQVSSLSTTNVATQLFLAQNYLYIATESSNGELQIVDVTTPASMYQIARVNISGNLKATDVFVLGSRAYISTQNNGNGDELFVYDISNPNQPSLLGSYDAGETIYSLAVVGPYALLGTNFLNKELTVVDISVPSSINYVNGYNLSGLILGMSANCSTIYAATSSNTEEFFIISTQITDCDYATTGQLESSTFDTGSSNVAYNWIGWSSHVPQNTSVRVQLATSNAATGPWNYVGPDGTAATYYTVGAHEYINDSFHHNQRYLRYRVYLDSQADLQAPILEEIRISYSSYE